MNQQRPPLGEGSADAAVPIASTRPAAGSPNPGAGLRATAELIP